MSLTYEKIQAQQQSFAVQVSDFFTQGGKGLNITLPFKQMAFALAQRSTPRCKAAAAANTLWMQDNLLHADNTDGVGLIRDLSRYSALEAPKPQSGLQHQITNQESFIRHCVIPSPRIRGEGNNKGRYLEGMRILILGAGGAARGIIHPLLASRPASLAITNRTVAKMAEFRLDFPEVQCIDFNHLSGEFDLIINATSASLVGEFVALPQECLLQKPLCYDLAYNQHEATPFVHYARGLGCDAVDGLGMLVEQAAEAFFIWHGVMPKTQDVLTFLRSSQKKQ